MDIILITGLWLPVSIWANVADELESFGHRPIAVALPGVDESASATLEQQLTAVLGAVDSAERPLVVGHSAASTLAWMAADRRPMDVAAVVMIGGFPAANGSSYADFFPVVDGAMAFPGWEPFDGPDSADLDDRTRAHIESIAVPVPAEVATAAVELSDDRRFGIPVILICPEYSPEDAKSWIEAGDIPELQTADDVSVIDIDSGHWPMITRPVELARILHDLATNATL
jgi:pimeloyl-ACP methyl ester carboxylesterase